MAIADWRLWGEFNPAWAASPRYADLLATEAAGGASEENAVLRTLRQMPAAERPGAIASLLAELVAETLRLPLPQIDHGLSLLSMGVDSLMAMELQTAIEKKVGVKVSTLELMKGSSLTQLAQQIALRIDAHAPTAGGLEPKAAGAVAPRVNGKTEPARPVLRPEDLLTSEAWQIAARLDELSDEQVDELLARVQGNEEIASMSATDALRPGTTPALGKREQLARALRKRASEQVTVAPLSPGQKALWFLYQSAPESPAYHVAFSARMRSAPDVEALRRSFQALVDRHPLLRATFRTRNGQVVQEIAGYREVAFGVTDCTGLYRRGAQGARHRCLSAPVRPGERARLSRGAVPARPARPCPVDHDSSHRL